MSITKYHADEDISLLSLFRCPALLNEQLCYFNITAARAAQTITYCRTTHINHDLDA